MSQITVCGVGVLKPKKQLDKLVEWFQLMRAGLQEKEGLGLGAIA
ncbi:MAG: hypothetical protein AAF609_08990 [Cyanobacteria bacterium P01_C01_bin.120]